MCATASERYTVAASETGDLRARGDVAGAVDLLIASGWMAQRNRGNAILGAGLCRLRGEVSARDLAPRAGSSLPGVRAHLIALATLRAAGAGVSARVVPTIVDQCLAAWMDPRCPHCEGRGFNGGDGLVKRTWCRNCGKSGERRRQIGRTDAERRFVGDLLEIMDKASRFAGSGLAKMLGG